MLRSRLSDGAGYRLAIFVLDLERRPMIPGEVSIIASGAV